MASPWQLHIYRQPGHDLYVIDRFRYLETTSEYTIYEISTVTGPVEHLVRPGDLLPDLHLQQTSGRDLAQGRFLPLHPTTLLTPEGLPVASVRSSLYDRDRL